MKKIYPDNHDEVLLAKIIGCVKAIMSSNTNPVLPMHAVLSNINQLMETDALFTQTINKTVETHAQIQKDAEQYMFDWETKKMKRDYRVHRCITYFERLISLTICGAGIAGMYFGAQYLGIFLLLAMPVLVVMTFGGFLSLFIPPKYPPLTNLERVDMNFNKDSERFFDSKKEALNTFLIKRTEDKPTDSLINRMESKIVRSSILHHYESTVYTSYGEYQKGRQLITAKNPLSRPMVDMNILAKEMEGLRRCV